LKALVLHHNLNSIGGEAAVAIHMIESLQQLGYEVSLMTVQKPDFNKMAERYGKTLRLKNIRYLIPCKLNYLGVYQRLLSAIPIPSNLKDVDIVVSTTGDTLPYNVPHDVICVQYIHFPVLLGNMNYKYNQSKLWRTYFKPYQVIGRALSKRAIARSNIVLANSFFTKDALARLYGIKANVLYPPVDIKRFFTAYQSRSREQKVLILSRFSPEKGIEKVIELSQMVTNATSFEVVGALTPGNRYYFNSLTEKINDHGLEDKIKLTPNASNEELIEIMSSCAVYLHTMYGEHFGVSIIEAMAAGLIPLVPSYGGCNEIVPSQCLYNTLQEAAERISTAIDDRDRRKMEYFHNIAQHFSLESFTESLKNIIQPLFESGKGVYSIQTMK
jgi:alpha-1,2-mannosyltransferase